MMVTVTIAFKATRCDLLDGILVRYTSCIPAVPGEGRGRIFCRESGEYNYEELNILKKGGNYGWNVKEGFDCLDQHVCGDLGRCWRVIKKVK